MRSHAYFLSKDTPASRVAEAHAPRWSLSAARLACQVWLARPDTAETPLYGRFAALQRSFVAIVDAGHGARWGDVPGEALLALADPKAVLRDAWPTLLADRAAGLQRLARLIDQWHRDENGMVVVTAVEPVITLLLKDHAPWRSGKHVQHLLRDWLRAHVVAETRSGYGLRTLLRQRLVEECTTADSRFAEECAAVADARAARTPEEIERERRLVERHSELSADLDHRGRRRKRRPDGLREITDDIVLEMLSLLGPDLGSDGEAILRRVARDGSSRLAPAVEESSLARRSPAIVPSSWQS